MKKLLLVMAILMMPRICLASGKAQNDEIYLIKTQGADSFKESNSIYMSCKLGKAQLKDVKKLNELVAKAHTDREITAMHIAPTVPSISYTVLYKDKELILKKDSETLVYRNGESSKALLKILDDKCHWK